MRGLPLRKWAKVLLRRVDFRGWAASKELAAVLFNICLRRAQMLAVHSYVQHSREFSSIGRDLQTLSPADFVVSALAAGECASIRAALRKKNIDVKVKNVLRSMQVATRSVEGTESERDIFRFKFVALRIWNGCSLVFFTLNPHDIKSPLLVSFLGSAEEQIEQVQSLNP